jgi:hypothetical protein
MDQVTEAPAAYVRALELSVIRLEQTYRRLDDRRYDYTSEADFRAVLEYDAAEDMLRMVSPVSEGVRGLRLGSLRIDIEGRSRGPVDLGELFSTE